MRPYDGNIFIKSYDNIDHIKNFYFSLTASPKFSIYQPMYKVSMSKQYLYDDIYGKDVSLSRPQFSLRINNRLAFRCDFIVSVNLNLSYHSAYASSVSIYKEGGLLDVNVYKSFFKNKLVYYLWGRDLLQT